MAKREAPNPRAKKAARREAQRKAARRKQIRNWAIGGVVLVVVVALVFVAGGNAPTGSTEIEAWDLPSLGPTADVQERVALADFTGKPTVVNFFASWCVECDRELPGFRTVSTQFAEEINWVGIASQETGNPLLMPERHGVTDWTLAQDVGGRNRSGLTEALGARGMPVTAFYDADGTLLNRQLGFLSEPQLRQAIAQLYGVGA